MPAFKDLLKRGPCQIVYPQLSPLSKLTEQSFWVLWSLGFWPCYSFCLFTCPPSLPFKAPPRCLLQEALPRCPLPCPSLHQEHFCAFLVASTHPTVVFLILGLTPRSRAPLPTRPQQLPKLHESRTVSVLSVGTCPARYLAQSRCSITQELVTRTFSVPDTICWPDGRAEEGVVAASLDPVLGGAICVPRPFPGPSWQGLPLPARPAITWPDDGFQQGDPSGQELQLSLLLQEAL